MTKPSQSALAATRDLIDVGEKVLPRVLYVPCIRHQVNADQPGRSALVQSLRGESWQVSAAPVPGLRNDREANQGRFSLVARLTDKFRFLQGLVRLLPSHDIVHLYCGSTLDLVRLAFPALILAKFFGKATLIQFSSPETELFLERQAGWYNPLLKAADHLIVGSRSLMKALNRAGLKATTLPNPLVLDEITHRRVSQLQPKILVNCPLEENYNVACAIRAFRLVKQKYPRSEMVLARSGSQEGVLRQLVEAKRIGGIEFAGLPEGPELTRLYSECDIYLNPASVEESPASLAMAFAAGLPVVTTDADGLLHMVRDGVSALVAPINDSATLANQVIELVENQELAEQLSVQGISEARKQTWSRLRQDWVNLYTAMATP